MSLYQSLEEYQNKNPIRFHMPGHKGKLSPFNPYSIDVTEVLDFDDLHNPVGKIKSINQRIANFYNCDDARLLVNGSTCGIMAAIFSMVHKDDKVLMPRACHKSVYNALALRQAVPIFLEQKIDDNGLLLPIESIDIKKSITENEDIKLCILTYPTYEGVVFDKKDMLSLLKENNIPVLIDAAHGAHLYKEIACLGDIVVTSLHKTLPFFTQTSSILFSKDAFKYVEKVDYYLSCFETSSPSYVLMAGVDKGMELLETEGDNLFLRFKRNIDGFYSHTKDLKNISIASTEHRDESKIVIAAKNNIDLEKLNNWLIEDNIIPEMKTTGYILCMAGIMNEKWEFEKLNEILHDYDKKLDRERFDSSLEVKKTEAFLGNNDIYSNFTIPMYKAIDSKKEEIKLEDAAGKTCGVFIDMFPPGIPVLIPGEQIEKKHIELVKKAKENNINIRGIQNDSILVVKWEDYI